MSENPTSDERLSEGQLLDERFRVEALFAETKFSITYRGHLEEDSTPVLLRTLALEDFLSKMTVPMVRKRFLEEAEVLASLEHENLETIYGAGKVGSLIYLATESLDDTRRLDTLIATEPPPPEESVRMLLQILEGLRALHAEGLTHSDLAPTRVRILDDGTVKLVDLALGRLMYTLRGSREEAMLFSPFSPPEVVSGEIGSDSADIYAAGTIGCDLLTGFPPYRQHGEELRQAILNEKPKLEAVEGAPTGLLEVIEKALSRDPNARYQRADEMAAAIKLCMEPPEVAATPRKIGTEGTDSPEEGSFEPVVVMKQAGPPVGIVAAILVLAIAVTGAFFLSRDRPEKVDPTGQGTRPTPSTPASTPPPVPGLIHSFVNPEKPPEVKNPLDGIDDVKKLSKEEKEELLEALVKEVNRQLALKSAKGARIAKEHLDQVAPDDARYYEIESQVLALAIRRTPTPKENQEVPLVTVDEAPVLHRYYPPKFPKRPPEDYREVWIKALVDASGNVVEAEIQSDDEFGDGAIALETVNGWTFEPALARGVKVKVWIAIPIRTGGEWKKPHLQVVAP